MCTQSSSRPRIHSHHPALYRSGPWTSTPPTRRISLAAAILARWYGLPHRLQKTSPQTPRLAPTHAVQPSPKLSTLPTLGVPDSPREPAPSSPPLPSPSAPASVR